MKGLAELTVENDALVARAETKRKGGDRTLRLALSYLCTKHNTVLAEVATDGHVIGELLSSVAAERLADSLAWAKKTAAEQKRREKNAAERNRGVR